MIWYNDKKQMQKLKLKLKKLISLDFYSDIAAAFLRFFIKKNPVGFFHKTFNKKHPYWSIAISVCFIIIIFCGLFYFISPRKEAAAWPPAQRVE